MVQPITLVPGGILPQDLGIGVRLTPIPPEVPAPAESKPITGRVVFFDTSAGTFSLGALTVTPSTFSGPEYSDLIGSYPLPAPVLMALARFTTPEMDEDSSNVGPLPHNVIFKVDAYSNLDPEMQVGSWYLWGFTSNGGSVTVCGNLVLVFPAFDGVGRVHITAFATPTLGPPEEYPPSSFIQLSDAAVLTLV